MIILAAIWFVWFCSLWAEMSGEHVERRLDRVGLWIGALLIPPAWVALIILSPPLFIAFVLDRLIDKAVKKMMDVDCVFWLLADDRDRQRREVGAR